MADLGSGKVRAVGDPHRPMLQRMHGRLWLYGGTVESAVLPDGRVVSADGRGLRVGDTPLGVEPRAHLKRLRPSGGACGPAASPRQQREGSQDNHCADGCDPDPPLLAISSALPRRPPLLPGEFAHVLTVLGLVSNIHLAQPWPPSHRSEDSTTRPGKGSPRRAGEPESARGGRRSGGLRPTSRRIERDAVDAERRGTLTVWRTCDWWRACENPRNQTAKGRPKAGRMWRDRRKGETLLNLGQC